MTRLKKNDRNWRLARGVAAAVFVIVAVSGCSEPTVRESAPDSTMRATADSAGSGIDEYAAAVCGEPTDEALATAVTYGETASVLRDVLSMHRGVKPPPEVAEWHRATLVAVNAMLEVAEDKPSDDIFDPWEFLGVGLLYGGMIEEAQRSVTPETVAVLVAHGCDWGDDEEAEAAGEDMTEAAEEINATTTAAPTTTWEYFSTEMVEGTAHGYVLYESDAGLFDPGAGLFVRCQEDSWDVLVVAPFFYVPNDAEVSYRLVGQPSRSETWHGGIDSGSMFAPGSSSILADLRAGGTSLVMQVTTLHHDGDVLGGDQFSWADTSGSAAVMADLDSRCAA